MDLLTKNKLADAYDYLGALDRKLVDADLVELKSHGIDLELAADNFVSTYEGSNAFVLDLKSKQLKRLLTQAQRRGALNVWLQENNPAAIESKPNIECFSCHAKFSTWDDLYQHKEDEHGAAPRPTPITEDPHYPGRAEGEAVIADTSSTMGLDLTNLPDGRYAVPNLSRKYMNDNNNVFIMVKRLRRTIRRDRRFVYGKVKTGDEIVPQGTIEVKIWSSDAKELIGEQKPGDIYRGELEEELELLMMSPENFARLFGRLVGHCCICGKTLTDDVSRQIGMGLECEKKTEYFNTKPKGYEPWCPTCHNEDKDVLGKVVRFHHGDQSTQFKCYHEHRWLVRKDGIITVLDPA